MKFKSIKLKNFRVFPDLSLDFSTDPEKNVTLIIGENRAGKTTFAQAMIWCLFGKSYTTNTALGTSSKDNKFLKLESDKLWSSTVKEKCQVGDVIETSVTLVIENNNIEYEFSRSVQYLLTDTGIESKTDKPMCLIHRLGEPVSTLGSRNEVKDEVAKLLPGKLVEFVFFNGEQINTFSEQLQTDNSSAYLKDAVETLLGNKEYDKAISHLRGIQGFKSVNLLIEDRLNSLASKDEDQKVAEAIGFEENRKQQLLEANSNNEIKIKELDTLIESYEAEIADNKEAAGHQNRIKDLEKENARLETSNTEILNSLLEHLRNDLYYFILGKYCCKIIPKLQDQTDLCSKDIPCITSDTIDFLINRGKCICGTSLTPDSKEYQELLALKEYIPPKAIGVMVSDYLNTIKGVYENAPECNVVYEKVMSQKDSYLKNDDYREKNTKTISEIQSRLGSRDNFAETVTKAQQNKTRALKQKHDLEVDTKANEKLLDECEITLKSLKSSRQKALEDNSTAALYNRVQQYNEAVIKHIQDLLDAEISNVKKNLDANVKRIFADIGWDDCEPIIDDDYKFSCVSKSDKVAYQLSTAQGLVSAISCIAGIINLTKEKLEKDPSQADISNNIPLVMDAPLSAFDKEHADRFCSHLPKLIDQLVIFTKDTEGNSAAESMKDRIGKMYIIKKQAISGNESSKKDSNLSYLEEHKV